MGEAKATDIEVYKEVGKSKEREGYRLKRRNGKGHWCNVKENEDTRNKQRTQVKRRTVGKMGNAE